MSFFKQFTLGHVIFYTIIFKVLLEMGYFFFLNPIYEYYGFTLDVNYLKFIESWLFMLLLTVLIPYRQTKPSNLILFVIYFVTIIPISSLYWLKNEERVYFYAVSICFFITLILIKFLPKIKLNVKSFRAEVIESLLIIFSIIIMVIIFLFNGLPTLKAINFNNVYIVRDNFNYGFPIMQYFVTWQANIINMLLILISLIYRKKKLFIFSIGIQSLLYLYTGHKSFLFTMFLFPVVFFMIKFKLINKAIVMMLPASIVIGFLTYKFFDFYWIASLSISRLLFLPAQISFQYFEFFSENKYMLLQHSIFEFFSFGSVYPENPIKMIGIEYYDSNWPNTGYFGDAYMNFGIIGIIIFSILLAFILKILDSVANKNYTSYLISMSFSVIFVLNLTSTGLLTALLNGGLGLIIFILIFYNKDESVNSN